MRTPLLIVFAALLLVSCSDYQKLLKSDDIAQKYTAADSLYKQKKYARSLRLMEQIVPVYRGKPQAEPLMFRYANTFYELGDHYLSGYQFERFEASYPNSDSVEVAAYKSAKSYYQLSPRYSLEQKETDKALEKLQGFINKFPNSEYRTEANLLVKELRGKKEKKDFEIAHQYLKISDFKASIEAFDNFIGDHPGSKYRKNAFFERFDAAYRLAVVSRPDLQPERFKAAKKQYSKFAKYYGDSDLNDEANKILLDIEKRLSLETATIE